MDSQCIAYRPLVKVPRSAVALAIALAVVAFSCGEAPAAQTGDIMGGASLFLAPKPAKAEKDPASRSAHPQAGQSAKAALERKANAAPATSSEEPKGSPPHEHHLQLPWSTGHNIVF